MLTDQQYDFNGNPDGPDVSFFRVDKLALTRPDECVQRFVPDLAVEIAFYGETWNSIFGRKQRYRSCGTEEVWLISPDPRKVFVFSTRGDRILHEDAVLATPLIPGFEIPVKTLFEADSD